MDFRKFKTERMLLASIAVLFLFLFGAAFGKGMMGVNTSSAQEESDAGSGDNEGDSEDGDGEDANSEDNNGEDNEGASEMSTPSTSLQRTGVNTQEVSEKSSTETSQETTETEEISEVSQPSEEGQEVSEESIKYVEGYGEVVSKEGDIALVKKDERLFFLIPVEVESQVTLDGEGKVIDSKQSFLDWLLSIFSF